MPRRCARSSVAEAAPASAADGRLTPSVPLRREAGAAAHRAVRWIPSRPSGIVEDEHERLRRREPFEQLTDGAVNPIALVLEGARVGRREANERREDLRQFAAVRLLRALPGDGARGPATYSSSASTKTQNGKSRSSSDADPESTRQSRSSARAASSAEEACLPDPGLAHELARSSTIHDRARRARDRGLRARRHAQRDARRAAPRSLPHHLRFIACDAWSPI